MQTLKLYKIIKWSGGEHEETGIAFLDYDLASNYVETTPGTYKEFETIKILESRKDIQDYEYSAVREAVLAKLTEEEIRILGLE